MYRKIFTGAALILSLGFQSNLQAAKTQKPNIILIYGDDLGRGMFSTYGQKHFTTPNIDRLAEEGIRFDNAYGCMYCAPARASLLTGMGLPRWRSQ